MHHTQPCFGAHLSVSGGLERAIHAGAALGCDCLQIFVKNQRQWRAAPLDDDQIARFTDAGRETGIDPIVAHASYLLNLASPESAARKKSVEALADELTRCEALGIAHLVVHPGSHLDGSLEAGVRRVAHSLDRVHRRCPGYRVTVLLETTAGQGSSVGWRLEQLGDILHQVNNPNILGVCLDTCHLFAAGYDFRKADGYAAMIDEIDRLIGTPAVKCIHLNDSKRELGSRVDRHEHIGKGKIGKAGFAHYVNDPRFVGIPMILETPKGKDGRGTDLDKVNLKRLRALVVREGA